MKIFTTDKVMMNDAQALNIMREARRFINPENNIPGVLNCVIAMEEFAECSKEISKQIRGVGDIYHLIEEMADCYICLKQLQDIFRIDDEIIDKYIQEKLDRQRERNERETN